MISKWVVMVQPENKTESSTPIVSHVALMIHAKWALLISPGIRQTPLPILLFLQASMTN